MTAEPWARYVTDQAEAYADYIAWERWMTCELSTDFDGDELLWWDHADIMDRIDLYAAHCDELDRLEHDRASFRPREG